MRHPFDGINAGTTEAAAPTRRTALGRMLLAAVGVLGVGRLARAQKQPATEAVNENGGIQVTTLAIGEEGATRAVGEAGGITRARGETGIQPTGQPQSIDCTEKDMEAAWAKLGDADAAKAKDAINQLYTAKNVVPFLKDKLKAEPMTVDDKQVTQLLKDLDSDDFAVREKASAVLTRMGPSAVPVIQAMMGKTDSLEAKRRLEMILLKLGESETVLQGRRGLQILVMLPDKEARPIVEALSKQAPETWLTREAKDALLVKKGIRGPKNSDPFEAPDKK